MYKQSASNKVHKTNFDAKQITFKLALSGGAEKTNENEVFIH